MSPNLFLKGLIIGFAIAAPVGPIGILCIRRSMSGGPRMGLAVGLGAASADAVYGAIAALGLATVSRFLWEKQFWVGMFGGVILCALGVKTFFTEPAQASEGTRPESLLGAFCSAFVLTLANPATILSFLAIFASLGLSAEADLSAAALLIAGVFSGSAAWWLVLSQGVSAFRSKMNSGLASAVNRISGIALLGFGLFAIFRCLKIALG